MPPLLFLLLLLPLAPRLIKVARWHKWKTPAGNVIGVWVVLLGKLFGLLSSAEQHALRFPLLPVRPSVELEEETISRPSTELAAGIFVSIKPATHHPIQRNVLPARASCVPFAELV
jgi:hypothetical protein